MFFQSFWEEQDPVRPLSNCNFCGHIERVFQWLSALGLPDELRRRSRVAAGSGGRRLRPEVSASVFVADGLDETSKSCAAGSGRNDQ